MTGLLFVVSFLLKWRVQLFLFFTSRKEHDSNGTSGYPPFLSVLCNLLALWLRNNFIRVKPCCNVANKMQQQCGLQDLILAPFNQNQYLITHCRYNQGVSSLDRFACFPSLLVAKCLCALRYQKAGEEPGNKANTVFFEESPQHLIEEIWYLSHKMSLVTALSCLVLW